MKCIYTIVFAFLIQACFSQQMPKALEGIDHDINLLIEQYHAVGLSVAIVKDNKIIYSKGFGYRNLETELPVTTNTVFPIGSVTKAFTGSLLGILESKNLVSLKDKPSNYVPNFQFYNDKMNNLITIDDLLSHKSGIGNQASSQVFFPSNNKLKVVQRLRYLKPQNEVKNSFEYSNMGYTLAGTIVEQITHKSWDTNIKEKIFAPLEMNNSYTTFEEMAQSNNYSQPYGLYNGSIEKVKFEEFLSISPAGAIKSTVNDMSNWMLTWLNQGMFNDIEVIPSNYVKKATRLQNIKEGNFDKDAFLFGDGFGWRLKASYGHFRIDHGGNTFGFSSNLVIFPFEGIGIVVLTNQDNSLLPYMITDNITRRLFEIDPVTEYPIVVTDIYKPSNYKPINKEKMPSQNLQAYCGEYYAKGFGLIKVVLEDNILYAVLPTNKFQLQHLSYDTFFLKPTNAFKDVYNPQFDVQFIKDTKGNISRLNIHSQKEPIEFTKAE